MELLYFRSSDVSWSMFMLMFQEPVLLLNAAVSRQEHSGHKGTDPLSHSSQSGCGLLLVLSWCLGSTSTSSKYPDSKMMIIVTIIPPHPDLNLCKCVQVSGRFAAVRLLIDQWVSLGSGGRGWERTGG